MNEYQNCISSMWTLWRILLHRDIPRYQKQQFAHVLLHNHSYKFSKIHGNAFPPGSFFNLQPPTSLEKRRRHMELSVSFSKFFRNTFIIENLLQTGFEKKFLRKMANGHSYYNKNMSWNRQRFFLKQKTKENTHIVR